MAIRFRDIRGLALGLAALAVLIVGSTGAQAGTIIVDPGDVGDPSSGVIANETISPSENILIVVFDDMKHIEVDQWGFVVTAVTGGATAPFDFTMFLSDEFGDIVGVNGTIVGNFNLDPGLSILFGEPSTIAHDLHFEFLLLPEQEFNIDVIADGLVGEWAAVPEPSTLTLFGAGLLGLTLLARRRRTGVGKTKHAS